MPTGRAATVTKLTYQRPGTVEDLPGLTAFLSPTRHCPVMTRRRMPTAITMYSTAWCGYCRRLKVQLDREGIDYSEVDIEHDPAAADYVMTVNGGNRTVPTEVFPDGTAAANPSLTEVKTRLDLSPVS
jgi:mycoredoxin